MLSLRRLAAATVVFFGGFIMMVIEIIGARYLAKDFGSSFHVWVSQIGVVLIALAIGYYLGGTLADWDPRLGYVAGLLLGCAVLLLSLPEWAGWLIERIISRHPPELPIPGIWQKLDPVIGSALVFLLPCVVLAMLSPFMIRLATSTLAEVGRSSGFVIASGTIGSIVGVFVSGFILIDHLPISKIFRLMGVLTALLALLCIAVDYRHKLRGKDVKPRA